MSRTLWSDRSRQRFFLIPTGIQMESGRDVLINDRGERRRVDAIDLSWFEMPREDAAAFQQAKAQHKISDASSSWDRMLHRTMQGVTETEMHPEGLESLGHERIGAFHNHRAQVQRRSHTLTGGPWRPTKKN